MWRASVSFLSYKPWLEIFWLNSRRGHLFWARGSENAGSYNKSTLHERVFLIGILKFWSTMVIVYLANLAFEGICIAAKLSGIHWWCITASHAAELTAGFYYPSNCDSHAPIVETLKKHGAALNFTCVELRTLDQHEDFPEALAEPQRIGMAGAECCMESFHISCQ